VLSVVLVVVLTLAALWAVKLVGVARSVERHAAYWAQPHGVGDGLLYVALGDSAAQGIGASRPQNGYAGLLADRLREASGRPVQVVNPSRSQARIRHVLERQIPAMRALGRAPDLLTVAVGGNDVRACDRETLARQAERRAAALPPGAYLADAPYFIHGRWERDARSAAVAYGLRPVPGVRRGRSPLWAVDRTRHGGCARTEKR
jgi:lysophospholipase L1-like esterase